MCDRIFSKGNTGYSLQKKKKLEIWWEGAPKKRGSEILYQKIHQKTPLHDPVIYQDGNFHLSGENPSRITWQYYHCCEWTSILILLCFFNLFVRNISWLYYRIFILSLLFLSFVKDDWKNLRQLFKTISVVT